MPMIDVHAHVFNAGYIPLRGVFVSRGLPKFVASPLARLLEGTVEADGGLPGRRASVLVRSPLRAGASAAGAELADAASLEEAGWIALLQAGADPATEFAREADPSVLQAHEADIDEALSALGAAEAEAVAAGRMRPRAETAPFALEPASEAVIEADLLRRPAGGIRSKLRALLLRVAELIEDGKRLISWIVLLLSRESEIAKSLADTYPEADLFVHHMMDMDPHYRRFHEKGSLYPFHDLQLRRMRALAQSPAVNGKLLTFVAYSPFHEDGVERVKKWLYRGCAGVKFYAPNGYRPIGNKPEDLEGTDQDPATVDRRNLELFHLCVELDIPIFAHCQPREMEAFPRAGCLSDPSGWATVLDRDGLKNLRLCLGHAGGEGWTAPPGHEDDEGRDRCGGTPRFVTQVVELCVANPNVYCEFGCLEGMFVDAERANFIERMAGYVRQHGDAFARKILYGSDWHMLAKAPMPGRYDDRFREGFEADPVLKPLQDRFFFRNTLEFLNLPGYLERSKGHISKTEEDHLRWLLERP